MSIRWTPVWTTIKACGVGGVIGGWGEWFPESPDQFRYASSVINLHQGRNKEWRALAWAARWISALGPIREARSVPPAPRPIIFMGSAIHSSLLSCPSACPGTLLPVFLSSSLLIASHVDPLGCMKHWSLFRLTLVKDYVITTYVLLSGIGSCACPASLHETFCLG